MCPRFSRCARDDRRNGLSIVARSPSGIPCTLCDLCVFAGVACPKIDRSFPQEAIKVSVDELVMWSIVEIGM